jgi:hypothetical protein
VSARDDELRRVLAGRDPRVDPREGDVVETPPDGGVRGSSRHYVARRVLWPSQLTLGAQHVGYQATPRGPNGLATSCSLRAWRRWAARGRVVCRGES